MTPQPRADRLLAIIGDPEGDVYLCSHEWWYRPSDKELGDRPLGSSFATAINTAHFIRHQRERARTVVRSPLQTTLLTED